jgi:hypothetical protein
MNNGESDVRYKLRCYILCELDSVSDKINDAESKLEILRPLKARLMSELSELDKGVSK